MRSLDACCVIMMRTDLEEVRASWEQRAAEFGPSLSGVLLRNLSEDANRAIGDWTATAVRDAFLPELRKGASVLDLGCGYGRLSAVIEADRPDLRLTGQDISLGYCRQYRADNRPCVVADVARVPFADGTFDGVLSVACLMYVPRNEALDALRGIAALLTPGGVALILDPGRELQQWIARAMPRRSASPTGGVGFERAEYRALAARAGFRVLKEGGNPALSLGLIVPGFAKSRRKAVTSLLASLGARDRTGGYSRFALHRWLLLRRKDDAVAENAS
jgi:SAM-dependent methyltransferase